MKNWLKMTTINRIIFMIVGTILVALGVLGINGIIGLSKESSSELSYLLVQAVLPIVLLIIGIYLLAQFYKKPDDMDKVKWMSKKKEKIR